MSFYRPPYSRYYGVGRGKKSETGAGACPGRIRKQRTRLFRRGTQQRSRRRQLVVQPGPLGS